MEADDVIVGADRPGCVLVERLSADGMRIARRILDAPAIAPLIRRQTAPGTQEQS